MQTIMLEAVILLQTMLKEIGGLKKGIADEGITEFYTAIAK